MIMGPGCEAAAVRTRHVFPDVIHINEEGLVQSGHVDEVDNVGFGDGAPVRLEALHRVAGGCLGHVAVSFRAGSG
jgi:hypothetical protein